MTGLLTKNSRSVQIFDMALNRSSLAPIPILTNTSLRLAGGVLVSVGVYYLARWLRRPARKGSR